MSELYNCITCGLVQESREEHRRQFHKVVDAPAAVGWKCPVCGAGNAPTTARCNCVPTGPVPATSFTVVGDGQKSKTMWPWTSRYYD